MRRYGHIPDTPDDRDRSFASSPILAAKPIAATSSVDHSIHIDRVPDQLGGSCVGWSISSAVYLGAAIAGRIIDRPSALFAYSIARLSEAPGRPLIDIGCRPRLAMLGLRKYGLVAENRWPENAATLNAVPPLDAFQEGDCARIDAYYRILDGCDVAEGIRHALARGHCPIFGMAVDTKYEQIGRDVYDGPGGALLGYHAQTVIGYSADRDAFKVLNSWGTSFGDGGFAWISARFLGSKATFDRWVITIAPESVR